MSASPDKLRIAAVGDLHCSVSSAGKVQPLFNGISEKADVLLLCGDLTDYGLPEEAHILAKELTAAVKIPMVAVLGNHDFESGKQNEVRDILMSAGLHVLDGEAVEIGGVGFAGGKGFGGGFNERALQPWGEEMMKSFVRTAVEEALKLESALARLRTAQKVALLHYSPIAKTVEGEPLEIYAFLGSSRLEDPLEHTAVSAVFHGHAHHGTVEGHTRNGTPVFNVAMPLLRRMRPDSVPLIYELARPALAEAKG
jgi:Icc-related predicted phosphoesterase